MRAEDVYRLDAGDVVHDVGDNIWVCVGWRTNKAGRFPIFVKDQTPITVPARTDWWWTVFHYHCAEAETLARKFPDVEKYRKPEQHLWD
jgi:hypothetical protein